MRWRNAKFLLPFILLVILCVNVICACVCLFYFQNVNNSLIFNECKRFSESIKNEFEQSAKKLDTFSSHVNHELYQLKYFHSDSEEAHIRNQGILQESVDLLNEFTEEPLFLLIENDETDTFENYSRILSKEQLEIVEDVSRSLGKDGAVDYLANYRIIDIGSEFLLIKLQMFYEYDYSVLEDKGYGTIISARRLEKRALREKFNLPKSMTLSIYDVKQEGQGAESTEAGKSAAAMVSEVIETNNESFTLKCILQDGRDISGVTNVYLVICIQMGINILLVGVCVYGFMHYIVNPLNRIVERMAVIASDSKERIANDFMCIELSILAARFNSLLDALEAKNKTIINTQQHLYELELCNKEIEMRALRSQLNPHFIYNMLENIRMLSEMNRNKDVNLVIVEISKFLRYSLYVNGFVTIADELNASEAYLKVMRICYDSDFRVEYEVDEKLKCIQIPKMIIQPIVENIFKHGFTFEQSSKNIIRIEVTRAGNNVKICVEDNGYGIAKEELDRLNQKLSSDKAVAAQGYGIGLYTINQRIKTIYGKEYGISVESLENICTRVTLILPIRPEKGE